MGQDRTEPRSFIDGTMPSDDAEPCIVCGAPLDEIGEGHDDGCAVVADHEYTGSDVLAAVHAATGGSMPAYVEQTGGNVATVYVGYQQPAIGYEPDNLRYLLAIGPGSFDWSDPNASRFYASDLSIGPDDEGEHNDEALTVHTLAGLTRAVRVWTERPDWRQTFRCEGHNEGGRWIDCNRTDPHGHGIVADVLPGTPEWDESERALAEQRRRGL